MVRINPNTLSVLKEEAEKRASENGHTLGEWRTLADSRIVAACEKCGRQVIINSEGGLSGSALEEGCYPFKKLGEVRVPHPLYGDFSINQAIRRVEVGGTVLISPGIYYENLVIDRSVVIKAAANNYEVTVILCPEDNQPVISVEGSEAVKVRLEGLTFKQNGPGNLNKGRSFFTSGILIRGAASLVLVGVRVQEFGKTGIYAAGSASVHIEQSEISGNGSGLIVAGNAKLFAIKSAISASEDSGVWVGEEGLLDIEGCSIERNQGHGVEAKHSSKVFLRNCRVNKNGRDGIFADGEVVLHLTGCRVIANQGKGIRYSSSVEVALNGSNEIPDLDLLWTGAPRNGWEEGTVAPAGHTVPWLPCTAFHTKVFATELTLKRAANEIRKLTRPLSSASLDLNPHQIDAALFAFRSPLSRGAILADEVGLGKTIEAGLVIAQLYAEHRRRILILVPASLRKQWQNELSDKFDLRTEIVEGQHRVGETQNPFLACFQKGIIPICSLHYAYRHLEELSQAKPFDLVVIDEAHHLRNVWKKGNKMAAGIRSALERQPKLLLTATPLHNNLMELYGLVSFIDAQLLGTLTSFRLKFMGDNRGLKVNNLEELRDRLSQVSTRVLRRQVQEYIRYTKRLGMLERFTPYPDEQELYEKVSAYLQRERLAAIDYRQRQLMLLVCRKLLASSSFAIAGTLESLIKTLQAKLSNLEEPKKEIALEDLDGFDEEIEELGAPYEATEGSNPPPLTRVEIEQELKELQAYYRLAVSIERNAKGDALLVALRKGFQFNRERGWPEKAVVFTESRRTQRYLLKLLEKNGYEGQVTTFSGQNTGPIAARAYERWKRDVPEHQQRRLSRETAVREALIHEFKHYTKIFLATEAGAEGVNLQFANIVVNYDLPWNPQRVEQRIGRCHRYRQKYDVVVLNFLNEANAADQRVYELLDKKLKLFHGVFGASDEVLGAIGSGVDFEKRILEIYQSCRTPEEINAAFDRLQEELAEKIESRLAETRQKILENFDDEVRARLKLTESETKAELTRAERMMLGLLVGYLGPERVVIDEKVRQVRVLDFPQELRLRLPRSASPGLFNYGAGRNEEGTLERLHLGHPIIQEIIKLVKAQPKDLIVPIELLYTEGGHKITPLEPFLGGEGLWFAYKLMFQGLEREEHLVHIVFVRAGSGWQPLDLELCDKFPQLTSRPGDWKPRYHSFVELPTDLQEQLSSTLQERIGTLEEEIQQRNYEYIDKEFERLERYTDDVLLELNAELEKIERQRQELRREQQSIHDFRQRMELRKKIFGLDKQYNRKIEEIQNKRRQLFTEKEQQIKKLENSAELHIEQELVAISEWRLF